MTVKDNEKDIKRHEEIISKLLSIVVGNGTRGMDEIIREIEKRVGVVESDMREVKKMVQAIVGYAGVTYDKNNHPGRRESDKPQEKKNWLESAWEKTKEDLFGKFVTAVIIIVLLNLGKLPELITELLK